MERDDELIDYSNDPLEGRPILTKGPLLSLEENNSIAPLGVTLYLFLTITISLEMPSRFLIQRVDLMVISYVGPIQLPLSHRRE